MFVTKRFIRNYFLLLFWHTDTTNLCAQSLDGRLESLTLTEAVWCTRPEKAEVGPGWPKPSILPPLDTDQYRLLDKLNTLQEYYKQIWAILGYSTTSKHAFILCLDMDNLRNIFQHRVALTLCHPGFWILVITLGQTWEKLKSFPRKIFGGSKFPQNSGIRDHL